MINTSDYPAVLNHTSIKLDSLGENDHSDDQKCHYDRFDMTKMTLPIIETQVLALATWHRAIYKQIDPELIRKFLAFRPRNVVIKTLEKTTQLAKMTLNHPLRRHVKPRNPHMNVTRIDEPVSTDPMFSNCKSIYHGYLAAQIFFGTKSHTIFVYGIKSKDEFLESTETSLETKGHPQHLEEKMPEKSKVN